MSTTRFTRVNVAVVAMVVASTSALAACATGLVGGAVARGNDNSTDPIVIGRACRSAVPLAGFGSFQKWGYEHAVKQVNDAGGTVRRRGEAQGRT